MVEGTNSSGYHPGRSSARSSGEGQHLGKPKPTAPGTGCMQVILTLMISQPKKAPHCNPSFLFGFKKICLQKAQHNEKMKNFGVKAINHRVVSVLYSSTEVDKEKHQQKERKPEQRQKLGKTETPSSSKN